MKWITFFLFLGLVALGLICSLRRQTRKASRSIRTDERLLRVQFEQLIESGPEALVEGKVRKVEFGVSCKATIYLTDGRTIRLSDNYCFLRDPFSEESQDSWGKPQIVNIYKKFEQGGVTCYCLAYALTFERSALNILQLHISELAPISGKCENCMNQAH